MNDEATATRTRRILRQCREWGPATLIAGYAAVQALVVAHGAARLIWAATPVIYLLSGAATLALHLWNRHNAARVRRARAAATNAYQRTLEALLAQGYSPEDADRVLGGR